MRHTSLMQDLMYSRSLLLCDDHVAGTAVGAAEMKE